MVRFFRYHFLQSIRRVNVTTLALVLMLGYLLGCLCSQLADSTLFHLMRMGAVSRVSIFSVLPVLLLPFFASAIAAYTGYFWMLFPIAFLKAFQFGYLCCAVLVQFPNSGLLFAVLFFWTDFLTMPVLCWFWLQCICGKKADFRAMAAPMLLIAGIGIFDHQVVSPFLASLLS